MPNPSGLTGTSHLGRVGGRRFFCYRRQPVLTLHTRRGRDLRIQTRYPTDTTWTSYRSMKRRILSSVMAGHRRESRWRKKQWDPRRRSPAAQVLSCYHGQEATVNITRPKTRSVGFLCTRNLGSAACDTDFQKILSKVRAGWWRDERRTFTVAEVVPSEALTAPPHSPWHSASMVPNIAHLSQQVKCAAFGFAPGVFSVDFAGRAAAISGASAGVGPV